MVKGLVHDPLFLAQKSEPADASDLMVAKDLLDTLGSYKDTCAGMAANMIGVRKNIIAVNLGPVQMVMLNAVITKKAQAYQTQEGCLSLLGGLRKTVRYHSIEVDYQDMNLQKHHQVFTSFAAQIIQHELDHVNGILI